MAPSKRKKRKVHSLSTGRPPTVAKPAALLSAKATRSLIRSHHELQRMLKKAQRDNDPDLAHAVSTKIAAQGGLKSYQAASKLGQSLERGGDSSKVLVEWLNPVLEALKSGKATCERLRVLEVGALETENAISRVGEKVDVTRIDLHSQKEDILEQDFMERPLPASDREKFHVVSLSLVLNYVSDAIGRGEMLRRVVKFLCPLETDLSSEEKSLVPCLFLVLPAACILNSRYLTEKHLSAIMETLGFTLAESKFTQKLAYSLWTWANSGCQPQNQTFRKTELRSGKSRNNFAIVLHGNRDAA